MRIYLCAAALLALASCAHPNTPPPPHSEPVGADAVPRDSTHALAPVPVDSTTIIVGVHRSLIDKVFGRTPAPITYTGATSFKAGKKSTITINHNHVAGNQTNSTNTAGKNAAAGAGATGGKIDAPVAGAGAKLTSIEKAKAPVATEGANSQDFTKQGQRGGAAASGAGATATATTVKPGFPWLKVVGGLAGAVGLYWVFFGGGGVLVLGWLRRRNSSNEA